MRVKIVTGSWYLGGFFGNGAAEKIWMEGKVEGWAESVRTLAGVARNHPQPAYSRLHKSLQQEWAFVQRVNHGFGDAFGPVEEALRETFLTALLQGVEEGTTWRGVIRLPVKHTVVALTDPTKMAPENWTASCVITRNLVTALRGQVEFRMADHSACLREGRTAVRKRSVLRSEGALATTIAVDPVQGSRQLQQATKTGTWLKVQLSTVNGIELGAQEWRDALFLRYGLEPPNLPHYCDGRNAKFSICHALDCKRVGIFTARHNALRNRVAELAGKAFTPSHVRDNSLIFTCCSVKRPKENPASTTDTTVLDNSPPLEAI